MKSADKAAQAKRPTRRLLSLCMKAAGASTSELSSEPEVHMDRLFPTICLLQVRVYEMVALLIGVNSAYACVEFRQVGTEATAAIGVIIPRYGRPRQRDVTIIPTSLRLRNNERI